MAIAEVRESLRSYVTSTSRLAIDNDVVVDLCTDLSMPGLNLAEIDIEIRAGNHAGLMLLWRANINEDKSFLADGAGLRQTRLELLHRQQIGVVGSGHIAQHKTGKQASQCRDY